MHAVLYFAISVYPHRDLFLIVFFPGGIKFLFFFLDVHYLFN